jgi:hypothetical protein
MLILPPFTIGTIFGKGKKQRITAATMKKNLPGISGVLLTAMKVSCGVIFADLII